MERLKGNQEISYALFSAGYLAKEANSEINLARFLGGLYIASFDHLQTYCNDWSALTRFILKECGFVSPTWVYWVGICEAIRSDEGIGAFQTALEVVHVQNLANQLALDAGRRVVTLPDLLLAIAKSQHFALCEQFSVAGIDLERVENEYRHRA